MLKILILPVEKFLVTSALVAIGLELVDWDAFGICLFPASFTWLEDGLEDSTSSGVGERCRAIWGRHKKIKYNIQTYSMMN